MSTPSRCCSSCGAAVPPEARFCGACGGTPATPAPQVTTPPPTQGARSWRLFITGCVGFSLLAILVVGIGGYYVYDHLQRNAYRKEVAEVVAQARVLAASDDPRSWEQGAVMLFTTNMRYQRKLSEEDRAELRQLLNELDARLRKPAQRAETDKCADRAKGLVEDDAKP